MWAIVGGLGAALAWAIGTVFSTRATREVGAPVAVAMAMVAGAALLAPWLVTGPRAHAGAGDLAWLLLGGAGNVVGLLMTYRALRAGDIGVVAPIVSAEGGVASLIAIAAGTPVAAIQALALGLVLAGMWLTAAGGNRARRSESTAKRQAARWAAAAAVSFGAGLYGTARASAALPLAWAVLPPRAVGVAVVAVPLLLSRRLQLTARAALAASVAGSLEVVGFLAFAVGSRDDVVITAILASLTGAAAALLGRVVFGERLRATQVLGVAAIVAGIAALSVAGT